MAAGTSSRFAPLSYERPKALIPVKGEILIERQIRQLKEAGVPEIIVVTGYKADQFQYLNGKFGVKLVHNPDYLTRNNNASIYAVRDLLANSYICSADNYFFKNPFESEVDDAYYAAEYSKGKTGEWCMTEDDDGYINSVRVGGSNAWYMLGHTFWSREFSRKFLEILKAEYAQAETADKLWERIFIEHLDVLKMKIRKYPDNFIFEFDSIDELRSFDPSYISDTRSKILKTVAKELSVEEKDLTHITAMKDTKTAKAIGFTFEADGVQHTYLYERGLKE
jgi:CTP:phosphocholine cytidylyltransferase-like protein